jgi:hypothetical protein
VAAKNMLDCVATQKAVAAQLEKFGIRRKNE